MKAYLMYRDRDFDFQQPLPVHEKVVVQDLELTTLFNTMAQGDRFLFEIGRTALLTGVNDIDTILYRQAILKDCLKNADLIRELYLIPIVAMEIKRKQWMGIYSSYPAGVLSGALDLMTMFVAQLRKLKEIADTQASQFESDGFRRFFAMIQQELDDAYFAVVDQHLKQLKFRDGVMISAELGQGNEGKNYILRKSKGMKWWEEFLNRQSPTYTFMISDRDDSGARALGELRDTGVNLVANALAQSTDHIDAFFKMLQIELAFYVGCLNLYEHLAAVESPICFPLPAPAEERKHEFRGLYDANLALTMGHAVVGNEVNANGKDLVIVTGANQGGKSTFLRSIGLAQLMMQCGMFVPGEAFSANLTSGVFTHYKREEDATMKSGKLDEELSRMSEIADLVSPNALVLFNESFAATNEREGSEIGRQITDALLERRIKVFFVTHQYELAHSYFKRGMKNAIFLRAERKTGGKRTYKLFEGEPLQTSFGEDVYSTVFGEKP